MPKQRQGKAAGCFLGSSHHREKPEAKQEGTFCSEPVQTEASSAAPAPWLLPPCWESGWDPRTPTPPSQGEALSPRVGQRAEDPNGEVICEGPFIIVIFTHKKLKRGK